MHIRTVHPFPARMAPDLALQSLSLLSEGSTILDPMSGSGTVLRQALELGHHAIGFDMDPLAVLMSKVWTSHVDVKIVENELAAVLSEALKVDLRISRLPWLDDETSKFMAFWFAPLQRKALTRLSFVLDQRRNSPLTAEREAALNLLQIALSRIIITKEQVASLARDTSHSRPHRVTRHSDYDVFSGFERSAQQLIRRVSDQYISGFSQIKLGDARKIDLADNSVDAIMTSPPYLNAIDYMRGHRMSLVWLGHSIKELRSIRSRTIGAERSADGISESESVNIANSMCELDCLAGRQQGMIIRYAGDLIQMMEQAARVLKPTGTATYVVGNSCLKDIFIRNADGVTKAGEIAGLNLIESKERELPAGSRYLPITISGSLSKRMRSETVLTFKIKTLD
ncbi:DNA methyltransferase [Pseudomonas syringae]|uniref:DNA methyltransferase n=1 Tax=Pseudomonas syringae TaxID=317 RepID=UPI0023FA138E|nr:DNA methyltransferase [Pseudomonas syringae]MDF7796074.1 DNA methyltransferase [Pseudomonas syringae]